jgi:hypothetical protein
MFTLFVATALLVIVALSWPTARQDDVPKTLDLTPMSRKKRP